MSAATSRVLSFESLVDPGKSWVAASAGGSAATERLATANPYPLSRRTSVQVTGAGRSTSIPLTGPRQRRGRAGTA